MSVQSERIRKHHLDLVRIGCERGVTNIRLFGSVARGQENTYSDIDLLVDVDPDRTLLDLVGFIQDAEALLGVNVDVATLQMMKERVREQVLTDAIPLETFANHALPI